MKMQVEDPLNAHLLVIVALALLVGQRSPLDLKAPFVVFVPCLTVALIFTTTGFIRTVYQAALIGLALCNTVLLEKRVPAFAYRALFAMGLCPGI